MGGCAQDFKAKYRFLGDAAVKEEEENNKEILREMMGSAPQSRREWGAPVTSAVTINDALDRRGRSIKLKQVVQASIKTKTTESWPGDETTYEDLTFEASVTRRRAPHRNLFLVDRRQSLQPTLAHDDATAGQGWP